MKKIVFLTAAFAVMLLGSCSKYDTDCDGCGQAAPGKVTVSFTMPELREVKTRSVDEKTTQDIYLFIYGTENRSFILYGGVTILEVANLKGGYYNFYAVANFGHIPDDISENELLELVHTGIGPNELITMSAAKQVIVGTGTPEMPQRVEMELVRCAAKVAFRVNVEDGCNVELIEWQLCSVPDRGNLFATEGSDAREIPGAVFADYDAVAVTPARTFETGSVYMPENRRGINSSSYKPDRRYSSYAPENSTYLRIRGRYDNTIVDYWIYLGNNSTTDYNVSRNTHYVYDVLIYGTNTNDLRINTYTPRLYSLGYNYTYYKSNEPSGNNIVFNTSRDGFYTFSITIECLAGEWQYMRSNGKRFTDGKCKFAGITTYSYNTNFYYNPPVFTPENRNIRLRYIITDQYGYETVWEKDYPYANCIKIYTKWNNIPSYCNANASGSIWGGIVWGENPVNYRECFIGDEPLKIMGSAYDGYQFEGWYRNQGLTQVYTKEKNFTYVPDVPYRELYTKGGKTGSN